MSKAPRTTKHRNAVGLRYQAHSDHAPTISVKGELRDADEIVRLAKRFGVPVVERKELVAALKALNLDESIPAELFEAIALVIARVDKKLAK